MRKIQEAELDMEAAVQPLTCIVIGSRISLFLKFLRNNANAKDNSPIEPVNLNTKTNTSQPCKQIAAD